MCVCACADMYIPVKICLSGWKPLRERERDLCVCVCVSHSVYNVFVMCVCVCVQFKKKRCICDRYRLLQWTLTFQEKVRLRAGSLFRTIHVQSRSLITKSDITNSGYNEAQKLIPAKILLYMNRTVSVIANSGYNEISVITNWFCYPQWTIRPLVTNRPLITNHMFAPCEKFKLHITKLLPSVRETFLKNGW